MNIYAHRDLTHVALTVREAFVPSTEKINSFNFYINFHEVVLLLSSPFYR